MPLAQARVAGAARVAEPHLGEPRGAQPSVLALFFGHVQSAFPAEFAGVGPEEFHRAVNRVEPSLIRVEADELTYDLHILLRFEIEREIVAGELALEDLPEAWNERMRSYLGVEVPRDADGVLQDVHWAGGSFGYFPTYTLGNVIAAQLWEAARAAMKDLDASSSAVSSIRCESGCATTSTATGAS